jgi:hypothetical protein
MIIGLLFLILFAILFPKALKFLLLLMFIGGTMILGEVHAKPAATDHDAGILSCAAIVNNGWARMPDVADYVLGKPNSDKLGYGSECHIGSLVFAQCFIEPKWSVREAVNALIHKAVTGKPLPNTPVCGA